MAGFIQKIRHEIHRYKILKKPNTRQWEEPRTLVHQNNIRYIFEGGRLETILKKIDLQKNKIFQNFLPHHRILIKINLNSSCPYPASTDPKMLSGLIDILRKQGLEKIWVGDCSSISCLPTTKVAVKTGIEKVLRGKAVFKGFDDEKWVNVPVKGKYLKHLTVPECLYKADRLINLSNMKTHSLANFSLGIKLLVGFMHPFERYELHQNHLQEKIADIGLVIQPDLSFIDARRVFITGGPDQGQVVPGNRVSVGDDMLETDIEAYGFLYGLKRSHNCLENFKENPFKMPQFKIYRHKCPSNKTWKIL